MSEELLRRARIPSNHWDCLLSEIPDEMEYKPFIVQYTDEISANLGSGSGLYIWGPHSSGKTGLASIICKAALNKGHMPLWIAAEKIPEYMCEDIYFDSDTLMRDRLYQVPLLVLDDLRLRSQQNLKSDWIERWLESIVRRRMDGKLCTIITSNNNKAALAKIEAFYAICKEALTLVEVRGHEFRPPIEQI